jgi:hypothetical protein
MTEEQAKEYLKNRGCSRAVWEGGTERLLQQWADFVVSVEDGYCSRCSVDEYWNDLTTRELIHDIGEDDKVRELDKRFRAMLTATHIKHRYQERQSTYDFWNYGYPKNASGFFLEHIKCLILQERQK